jgi:hypothetical protein
MPILFAAVITTIAAIEAAGYFFKLNKNIFAAVRTLFIIGAIWFAVKANHETATPQAAPRQVISNGDSSNDTVSR